MPFKNYRLQALAVIHILRLYPQHARTYRHRDNKHTRTAIPRPPPRPSLKDLVAYVCMHAFIAATKRAQNEPTSIAPLMHTLWQAARDSFLFCSKSLFSSFVAFKVASKRLRCNMRYVRRSIMYTYFSAAVASRVKPAKVAFCCMLQKIQSFTLFRQGTFLFICCWFVTRLAYGVSTEIW